MLYESRPSLQVCAGTHDWVDNFVPFLASELGLATPPLQRYRWLAPDDLDCPDGINGCATQDSGIASSARPYLLHELVHTTLTTLDYPYQPFFGEGIAVALDPLYGDNRGPTYLVAPPGQKLTDPRPWMTYSHEELNPGGYSVAGSYVSFLIARHGPAKFLEFLRELGTSRDLDVIKTTFDAVYGLDLDAESELFMVGAPCTGSQFHPSMFDCTAPELPRDGERWYLSDVMDCASDTVAGGIHTATGNGGPSLRSLTFDVPVSGTYFLRLDGDGTTELQLGPCRACPWRRDDNAVGASAPQTLEIHLEAGPHFVRIQADSDRSPSFTLEINQTGFD